MYRRRAASASFPLSPPRHVSRAWPASPVRGRAQRHGRRWANARGIARRAAAPLFSDAESDLAMLEVELPDGSVREYPGSVRPIEIAAEIGPAPGQGHPRRRGRWQGRRRRRAAAGRRAEVRLRLLTKKDPEALAVMRHSCAHVMARAVMRLFDGVQLAFGPTIDNGFYYDFDLPHKLSEDDFPAIEAEMARIIKMDEPFERIEEPRDKALEICRDLGQKLKVEHIQEGLADQPTLSFYRQGEFIDLCRGPHVPAAGAIGAFKLLSSPGPIGKGTPSRQQLQRLYATAWFSKRRAGKLSEDGRRSQAPRPSRAGQATRTVHHQSAGRRRA